MADDQLPAPLLPARTRAATGWSRNLAPGSHPGLPRGPAAHLVRVDGVASATLSQTVAAWLTISSRLHYLRLTPPSHRTGRVRSLHGALWASPVTAAAAALPPADGTRHGRGPAGSGVATHPCPAPAGHATWLPALTSVSYVGQLRTRSEWMVSLAPRSRGQSRHGRCRRHSSWSWACGVRGRYPPVPGTGWSRNLVACSHLGLLRGPAAHTVRVDGVASASISRTVAS